MKGVWVAPGVAPGALEILQKGGGFAPVCDKTFCLRQAPSCFPGRQGLSGGPWLGWWQSGRKFSGLSSADFRTKLAPKPL